MANIDSASLNKNNFMQAFGQGLILDGVWAAAVNPTAADVVRVMKIPAGTKVNAISVANADLDSNGSPTIVFGMGYAPVNAADGPAASAAYFQAAGDTSLQAANAGKLYSNFAPISFQYDVYLTLTIGTASATFAAGSVYVNVFGEARGVK